MIYTVTFNPALDYAMHIDALVQGETNRSSGEYIQFGGKGVNVSVVLSRLRMPTTALGFIAGFTGEALEKAVKAEGVCTAFIHLESGLTRINVKLKGEKETEINANGPMIDGAALDKLYGQLDALQAGDTLVLAGSVPHSLPRDIYRQIMHRLQGRCVRVVVDAVGEVLKAVLPLQPFLIKPNLRELEELCGRKLPNLTAVIGGAKELQAQGAQNVLVSLGKDGAVLLDVNGETHTVAAHKGIPINTVGAGDSMVAGFLAGVDKGYAYALALGNAAGGATAFSETLAQKEQIAQLLGDEIICG